MSWVRWVALDGLWVHAKECRYSGDRPHVHATRGTVEELQQVWTDDTRMGFQRQREQDKRQKNDSVALEPTAALSA